MIKKKFLLILNEIFRIMHFFRRPFAIIGVRTARQIKKVSIFLSFFILSIEILQINFQNQKFVVFKHYPILSEKKISQKFETFFLKSTKDPTIYSEYVNARNEIYNKTYQNLSEKKKNLIDFYDYLDYRSERVDDSYYEHPQTLDQIQNLYKKNEVLNIYKNFEQINLMLNAELTQQQEEMFNILRLQYQNEEDELLINWYIDVPYLHWSVAERNFNQKEYIDLLNWRFKNKDLVIRDLKKENSLDKMHTVLKKLYPQYQKLIQTNVDEEFHETDMHRIFLFTKQRQRGLRIKDEKYKIQQNKIFIETEFITSPPPSPIEKLYPIDLVLFIIWSRMWDIIWGRIGYIIWEIILDFLFTTIYQEKIIKQLEEQELKEIEDYKQQVKQIRAERKKESDELEKMDNDLIYSLRLQRDIDAQYSYVQLSTPSFLETETFFDKRGRKIWRPRPKSLIEEYGDRFSLYCRYPRDSSMLLNPTYTIPSYTLTHSPYYKIENLYKLPYLVISVAESEDRKQNPWRFFNELKARQIRERELRFLQITLKRFRKDELDKKYPIPKFRATPKKKKKQKERFCLEGRHHYKIIKKFKSQIPPSITKLEQRAIKNKKTLFEDELLNEEAANWDYYIKKLEDQIPYKLQGFEKVELPILSKPNSPGDRLLSTAFNVYRLQEYEIQNYSKSKLEQGLKKLASLHLEAPKTYSEYCKMKNEKSNFYVCFNNINLIFDQISDIRNYKTFYKFLETLVEVMNLKQFKPFFKPLKKSTYTKYKKFELQNLVRNRKFLKNKLPIVYLLPISKEKYKPEYNSRKAASKYKKERKEYIKLAGPQIIDNKTDFTVEFFGQYITLDLNEYLVFQEWREKTNRIKFSRLFLSDKKISPVFEQTLEKPHLNMLVNAEDYLLELIFDVLDMDTINLKLEQINEILSILTMLPSKYKPYKYKMGKKTKYKLESRVTKPLATLFPENEKNNNQEDKRDLCIYPSKIISFILNFLNFRKYQRELFFERISPFLETKKDSTKHESLINYHICDSLQNRFNCIKFINLQAEGQIFLKANTSLAFKKFYKYNYLFGPINKIPNYFLLIENNLLFKEVNFKIYLKFLLKSQQVLINICQIILFNLNKYNNEKFQIQFIKNIPFEKIHQFLLNIKQKNQKYDISINSFRFKPQNWLFYSNRIKFLNKIPDEFFEINKMIYYFIWLQKYFLTNESLENIEENFIQYFEAYFKRIPPSLYINKYDYSQVNDEIISFKRKLPRILEVFEFPLYILSNSFRTKANNYPYKLTNVDNLNRMLDPIKGRNQKTLKNQYNLTIENFKDEIPFQFNQNDFLNDKTEDANYLMNMYYEVLGKMFYELENFSKEEKKNYLYEDYFQQFFKDKIVAILNYYVRTNYFTKKIQTFPIFKNSVVRQMSGYFYPDFWKTKKMRKILITKIPIDNKKNIEIYDKKTKKLEVIIFDDSKPQFQIFKNLGLPFFYQIFELNEPINQYSWSILFFFSIGFFVIILSKNIFKKYAKEVLESGINLLYYSGLLRDQEWAKQEVKITTRITKGYRDLYKIKKTKLTSLRGLKSIILRLSEMIYFLKQASFIKLTNDPLLNYCVFYNENHVKRDKFYLNYSKPKGFLFNGAPGTGKTFLVQAIVGESKVPVVTQSGGLMKNPRLRGKGAQTIHKLFIRARAIAPCLIFIDELDGIGIRRYTKKVANNYSTYDIIQFLESVETNAFPPEILNLKIKRKKEFVDDRSEYWKEPEFTQTVQSYKNPVDILEELQSIRKARNEQINILIQLLIELDGVHPLDKIIVIGATNQIEILDPALIRPGRLQLIFHFFLPGYNNRIKILKFYTKSSRIGTKNISWDYFSKRTNRLSSADVAAIVFASELIAIRKSRKHTFETLERGIELITSYPSDPLLFRLKKIFIYLKILKQKFFSTNNFYFLNSNSNLNLIAPPPKKRIIVELSHIIRSTYYNIGKMFIGSYFQYKLQMSSFDPYITLWARPKNFRFVFFTKNFNEFDDFEKKKIPKNEIEKRFLTFFGGKVAESIFIFLPLQKFSAENSFNFNSILVSFENIFEQSDFEIQNELQIAQDLLKLIIKKWNFYSDKIATEKFHPIFENSNLVEYVSYPTSELFVSQVFIDEMIVNLNMRNKLSLNEQKRSYKTWWIKKTATQLNYIENRYHLLEWSRIYLSDPQNSIQNIEWVSPDKYFNTILRTPPYCIAWSLFMENRHLIIKNLVSLQAFNVIFRIVRQFSELFDFLSDYLLRTEYLTENELDSKIYQFYILFKEELFKEEIS